MIDNNLLNAWSLQPHISNQCGRPHTAHSDVLAYSLIESDHWWNFSPNFPLLKQHAPEISKSVPICKTVVDLVFHVRPDLLDCIEIGALRRSIHTINAVFIQICINFILAMWSVIVNEHNALPNRTCIVHRAESDESGSHLDTVTLSDFH